MEDGCSRMMGKSEGFLKMRETERERNREKNERKVRETLQNIYAQANLRDIYIYTHRGKESFRRERESSPRRILQARRLLHNSGVRQKQNYVHEKNTRVTVESSHSLGSRALENPRQKTLKRPI